MTDAVQMPSIAAATRPASNRSADPTAVGASGAAKVKVAAVGRTDTTKPVEPTPPVEPTTRLTITRDKIANTFVYRSIDTRSGDVIWQYPVEQVLRMAHRLREMEGLDAHKVDEKA